MWVNYPIPFSVSIWGVVDTTEVANTESCPIKETRKKYEDDFSVRELVKMCLSELSADIALTEQVSATGLNTYLPKNAREVISVKLDPRFQGNRYVKHSYDSVNKIVSLRVFPATIKYSVSVDETNVDKLTGDMLRYTLAYVSWKMASKEYTQLTSVTLNADNGEVNLSALAEFRDDNRKTYDDLKPEILIYSAS